MRWRKQAWAAASGVLLGISVLPTDKIPLGHWSVFFGFVPLWHLWLNATSKRNIFRDGWIAQFLFTLFAFNWIAHTVHEFSFLSWPVAILVLLLFCALANLYLPLAGIAWAWLFPARIYGERTRILSLVLITALAERAWPMIFEWNFGYVWFYKQWPGYHLADLVGFRGLSAVCLTVNGLVLLAWRMKVRRERWWIPLTIASVFLMALNWAGAYRHGILPNPDSLLRVLVVQANIGNKQKHQAEFGENYRDAIVAKYVALTEGALAKAGPRPDFVVWPENAFPDLILEPLLTEGKSVALKKLLLAQKVALVTGGYGFNGTDALTNSIFLLSSEGKWAAPPYRKTVLLPFGEYIPGARWFPGLKKLLPHVRNFSAGPGPEVAAFGGVRLGLQICYEGLFDWFAAKLGRDGAQVILNVTNDSWYGTWEQPYQHFYMTLGRAIETRLPLLRATNTGISGAVLASGNILEASPLQAEWTHLYEIPYVANPAATFFSRYGYWLVPAIFLALLAGLVGMRFLRPQRG